MREKLWELGYCDDQVGYLSWVKVGFEFWVLSFDFLLFWLNASGFSATKQKLGFFSPEETDELIL